LLRDNCFKYGNITKDTLADLYSFKNDRFKTIENKLNFENIPLCGNCEVKYVCKGGGCRAVSHLFMGDIRMISPFWNVCYYKDKEYV
jgi:radical SAM protein with 4Fe4S-binding SPASM domain